MKGVWIFLAIVMLYFTALTVAEVPQLINYQGRLTNVDGNPVEDGSYQIKFKFYNSASGHDSLWSSGFQTVQVNNCLFNYTLGSDVPIPEGIFGPGVEQYLGITIGGDAEISPRTKMTSSIFAFRSSSSDSAYTTAIAQSLNCIECITQNHIAAEAVTADKIAPDAIDSTKIIDRGISTADIGPNGAISGQVLKWDGESWRPANDESSVSNSGGGTFVRWGSNVAPSGASLIYTGYSYAGHWNHSAPIEPVVLAADDPGSSTGGYNSALFPLVTMSTTPPGISASSLILGAVCYSDMPSVLVWGTHNAPEGWLVLYRGYAMAANYSHNSPSGCPICVESENFEYQSASGLSHLSPIYPIGVDNHFTLGHQPDRHIKCVVLKKQ